MGYETKLMIGLVSKSREFKNPDYFSTIATIEMGRSCFEDTWIDEEDKIFELYFCNGDDEIKRDPYGHRLYAIDPKKVLKTMETADAQEKYVRYGAAIPMLKILIHEYPTNDLQCILFGH